jgi:WD40 repeat protein/serine/threonine protein kinase
MKPPADEPELERSMGSSLVGALSAAVPDVTEAEEHRRRKDLVRQRLLGEALSGVRIGRFTLLGQVGSGAMSMVYAAYDDELDRRVAVKLLRTALVPSDVRLRREARALARLSHPNVVAVHEIGHWEGRLFIAMELVDGQTLDTWLDERPRTWQEIVDVLLQAGSGLAAAHEIGLVHRDFKPTNVMVGEDGRVRVLDFGLVRRTGQPGAAWPEERRGGEAVPEEPEPPAGSGSETVTGACVGTPAYMAPEQRAGLVADVLSDQFSFCVALHEALFDVRPGEPPEDGRDRHRRPVPARLARAIERGLAADPRARWPSMRHLLGALERLRGAGRRWRIRAAMLGLTALVVGVALWGQHLLAQQAERQRVIAERQRVLAHDARLVMAAQRLIERDPTAAAAALREVRFPDSASGWRSTATAVLLAPLSSAVIQGPDILPKPKSVSNPGYVTFAFDQNGSHVLTHLRDDVLSWRVDGRGPPVQLLVGQGEIATLSNDRAWLLAWKLNDTKLVLARTDGSARRTFGDPHERVASASFTGTGTDVVTVSPEGMVRLWRSGGSELLGTPPREIGIEDPSRLRFSVIPATHRIIAVAPSGDRWLWTIRGTGPVVHVKTEGRRVGTLSFSPDGQWFGVAVEDGDLELWNSEASRPLRVFHGHEKKIVAFDISPDGRQLATASHDGTARIWPVAGSGAPMVLRGHTEALTGVRFAPEGGRVVTTSRDRTARIWSLDGSGDVMVLRGHSHQVAGAVFSPDGRTLVTYGREPSLRLWDISRRPVRILGRHTAEIWSASFDSEGRRLVTAAYDGTAKIFHLDGSRPPIELRGHEDRELYTALFSPDGRRVATGGADGTARIWNADGSGEPLVLRGHYGWVYGMAFSPDGRWLATGSKDGEIRLTSTDGSGTAKLIERGARGPTVSWVHSLIFNLRGDRLLADTNARDQKAALLWISGERRAVLGNSPPLSGHIVLAMSRDGRIATGEKDGTLRIWSPDGSGPLKVLPGHAAEIIDLTFSRDGKRLLSASFDGSARIWDLEHGGEPLILRGHEDWVNKAAFDADERRVVTASSDGTARVWRLDEPDQPIVLRGHERDVRFAGFTPEGRVVTASFDGTVRLWSLDEVAADTPSLMAQLRHATTACLTADQRMQYLEETAAVAAARFADCERAADRAP